jgi:uncharacterized protein (TIGR02118 family)
MLVLVVETGAFLSLGERHQLGTCQALPMQELIAVGSDPRAGKEVAAELGGKAYVVDDDRGRGRLFESLVRAQTDDLDRMRSVADIGLYVAFSRQMKAHPIDWPAEAATPGVTAAFAMVRRPDLSHVEADTHWRDVHAPLALRHHPGMWDYCQCSVVHTIEGSPYDGFALCSFASEQDLRERFFDGPEGQEVIRNDVAKFSDTVASPRRVLATEWLFDR